jgi:hypothetical protein
MSLREGDPVRTHNVSPIRARRRGRPVARLILAAVAASLAVLALFPAAGPARASAATGHTGITPAGAQAMASVQARRTSRPVTVNALTTPDSVTQALPDGDFKMTTSSQPVRAWTGREWQPLNATLRRDRNGSWSPAVSTTPVSVSGGGGGPLAVLTNRGYTVSLHWPRPLPRPVVTGDTAVYPSVFPGTDLHVAVTSQGGFRDVLVIRDRAAATAPGLRHLALTVVTTGGLRITESPGGTLEAAGPATLPQFTTSAPLVWDSRVTAPAPAGQAASRLQAAADAPGAPAVSTADHPGRRADVTVGKIAISAPQSRLGMTRQTLTIAPWTALAGSAVFPVYASSVWLPSGGTRGWYASDDDTLSGNWYDKTADPAPESYLQIGDGGAFNAHTFFEMYLHPAQLDGAVINSAVLGLKLEHTWSCTATPMQLWWAGVVPTSGGNPWVSWGTEPAWKPFNGGPIASVDAGDSTTCNSSTADASLNIDITSFMKFWGPGGPSTVTFGLKAPNLGNEPEWKEFSNASGAITMTTYYAHPPAAQAGSYSSPGGDCQAVAPARTMVGNDDLTLNTTPYDQDPGALTTEFVVLPYQGTTKLIDSTVSSTSGVDFSYVISRNTLRQWGAGQYEWYTTTTDQAGLSNAGDTGLGSKAKPCYFEYDPNAPGLPYIQFPAGTGGGTPVGALGTRADFTFWQCEAVADGSATSCPGTAPAQYAYQVNDDTPVTVAIAGNALSQTVPIPLTRVGVNTITVVGISAAGNPGGQARFSFDVSVPGTPYADGDYAGTGHPDLITIGDGTGSTADPGLWMAESDGAGHLSTPIDIGVQGLAISTESPPDDWINISGTPGDWARLQVLHGDFTNNKVQDIVAYNPADGNLRMIGGPGNATPLAPDIAITGETLNDPLGTVAVPPGVQACPPIDVVAAGNATLQDTGLPDLAAIVPYPTPAFSDCTTNYELNLYYATAGDQFSEAYDEVKIGLSTTAAPDGSPWGPDWTLEVAQPSSGPVLLALDKSNGELWESVNTAQSASTLIGSPGTWTRVTGGPWTGSKTDPSLVQADVNSNRQIELWTVSGGTATSWVLTPPVTGSADATLAQESANMLQNPGHAWPLTDGPSDAQSGIPSLIDTESATGDATPSSGLTFTGTSITSASDPMLGPVAVFDNSTSSPQSYLTLPAGILQNGASTDGALQSMTLTLKFRASPGTSGILAGTSTGNITDATLPNTSAPIIYIGTDGRLYAQFPSGQINSTGVIAPDITPLTSSGPVTDGQWHTVTLVADGANSDQILYLDNNPPVHSPDNHYNNPNDAPRIINPGQTSISQTYTADQVTIGAGIFSTAGWVDSDATYGANGTTHPSYFSPPAPGGQPGTAEISDIAFYPRALTQAQLPQAQLPQFTTASASTVITSGVYPGPCIDNNDNSATAANRNPIDVYSCSGSPAQEWLFEPDGTIRLASDTSYCLDVTDGGTANGTLLDLYTCLSNDGSQQWQLLSDGEIMNPQAGKCVNLTNGMTTDGNQLQLYNCAGDENSIWSSRIRPAESPATGTIVSVQDEGNCIQNAGGSSSSTGPITNLNPVQVGSCNGWPSQQWTFEPDGTIRIGGMCLDNYQNQSGNGNPEDIYTCDRTGAQQWAHLDTGSFYNPYTGECLDAADIAPRLSIYQCNDTGNQTWIAPDTYHHT